MAIPFKTKDVNEEVTSKDIKSLMEQANYTNKYLQALGETIKTKVVPKQKSIEETSPRIPIEKPLFKPFKVSEKAKRKIRELRKTKSLIEGVGDNHSELLNKIGSLLKVIPDTPQASENTSKMVTRSTSKLINVINEDSDQNSDNTTEIGSVANNIYEWNIDAQTEYNIMNTLQHMTMVATAYQTSHECSEETIIDILVAGFSGQLKGCAVKTDLNGKVITNDDNKEIPDAVNTLIFTIAQHFIGDPSLWKDRSAELLSNLKCRTLADFRWYRDTFLTRVYTREDSQQPFWKEKFLAGLPRSLGDKVRDKIRSQSANGDIPYESLSYSQLISYVQKVALKICQDDKIQRQLAKEKAQTKRDLGSFCEQFGLPTCHISKYCRLKKKLRNLNLEPAIEEQINNLLIETSEEETETSSSVLSDENLNLIQQDDQLSSTDDDDGQINTLTREQDLLFEAINSIPDPQEKKVFLEKLKKTLERLENSSTKPTTIQDLQTEINNLKREVKELRQQQEIHQIILSQLEEDSDSESTNNSEENQPENLEDDMFMGLINKIKIQKFYINIKIIINDFVLETMALFDTGADSNCILEGLIPTKFFEKTSEKLSTANGSKLKINFKLSNAIIENQGLKINTNFLLVLAIVLCISKFQSDLLNQKFLIRVDCKSAKDILQKDVKNLASKQIFARWQAILSVFDFDIEYIKGTSNSLPDYLTREFLQKSGKLPLAKAQTPPTKQTNNYIYKNKLLTVLQMEPEFWDKSPFKATAKAFPPGFHYKPTTILKTRTFYELILVDSNSVSIKHFKDPKDQTLNTHSTIQILKVLQPRHFGSDLNKGKRFSVPFDPVGYTYWDYVDAWTKVFWHQNTRFKHSWLIYFKTNTIYNFPNWFLQWWDFFGPIPEIFPETVQQGFSQFKKQYNSQESRIPADLKYFSSFALSWIFSWQYRYSKTEKTNQYPSLQRHAFVKWWTQFDSSKADAEQIKLWFQSHPEFLKAADPETSVFLNQKSHLAAFLAGSTTKEVLAKNLKEVLQMLQQEEGASSSKKEETSSAEEDEEDPFYQNEDDCFGICLD
ncbi:hypothetical protein JHK86_004969 [Glycine max]|nr:hypothetical protein JHK86_004969 [Glycine max]